MNFYRTPTLAFVSLLLSQIVTAQSPRDDAQEQAQDTVVLRTESSGAGSRRRGEILSWKGNSLMLATSTRTLQIDNEQIEEIETNWSAEAIAGRHRLRTRQFSAAIAPLKQAISREDRLWAQNILRADLVTALLATEQPQPAVEQFEAILSSDPNTRFLYVAPLAWFNSPNASSLVKHATEHIASDDPTTRLIAASWLVGGPKQEQAIETLEELSRWPDELVARLASAQVWRIRRNVSAQQLELWRQQVLELPLELQAGPWFGLADHFSALGNADKAAIHWMRLPILHSNRPDLAPAALYRAARLMHNEGQPESSEMIRRELIEKFPDSGWAARCRTGFRPTQAK